MKRISLILILLIWSVQYSCTTQATSAELGTSEIQEITIARNVDAGDFEKILKEKQTAVLLDVRTPPELAQGFIAGAKNIDIKDQKFRAQIDKLDKTQPVLVYCRSGRRSAAAMRYMRDLGFSEVYNLNGGIMAWGQAGLPVIKQ